MRFVDAYLSYYSETLDLYDFDSECWLNSNKGTKRDMAISLIPFDRLDFRTLGYPQNGAPFSLPILGAESLRCPVAFLPRNHTRRAG
jgi:hypothetical protein